MSRTTPADIETAQAAGAATFALLWTVTRTDAQVFGFTNYAQDITYDGVTHLRDSGADVGESPTSADASVDTTDIQGLISGPAITQDDLEAGVWNGAAVVVRRVLPDNLAAGHQVVRFGTLGEVRFSGKRFTAELRTMADKLQRTLTRTVLPTCDADIGDARCGYVLPAAVSAVVSSVTGDVAITASGLGTAHTFDWGRITWTLGANAGRTSDVKRHTTGVLVLRLAPPYPIQLGDAFDVQIGCAKTLAACAAYGNVVNFRGHPHLPGNDALLRPGGV